MHVSRKMKYPEHQDSCKYPKKLSKVSEKTWKSSSFQKERNKTQGIEKSAEENLLLYGKFQENLEKCRKNLDNREAFLKNKRHLKEIHNI